MFKKYKNYICIYLIIVGFQLFVVATGLPGADDVGADYVLGKHEIVELIPNPLEKLMNGVTETIFFALQAALGMLLLAYALETLKNKKAVK